METFISIDEICHTSVITRDIVLTLVEEGIVTPVDEMMHPWMFEDSQIPDILRACRLQRELSLNWHAVALLIPLLDDKARLERENNWLKGQLAGFLGSR